MTPVATTRRARILQAVLRRLETITVEGGYETDAGRTVYLGSVPSLGPADPKYAIAIVVREDQVGEHLSNIRIRLPIDIAVVARFDAGDISCWNEVWLHIEAMLGDVKTAMELDDREMNDLLQPGSNSLGLERGTTEPYHRESGSVVSGFAITYVAPYVEAWGHPSGPLS